MKALLYKDFQTIGAKFVLNLAVIVFISLPLFLVSGYFSLSVKAVLFIASGATAMSIYSFDEKSHWHKYCDVLPLSRKQVVMKSFVGVLIFNAAAVVPISIFHVLGILIHNQTLSVFTFADIIPGYIIGAVVTAMTLFLAYTFNYIVSFIVFSVIGGGCGGFIGYGIGSALDVESSGMLDCLPIPIGTFYVLISFFGIILFVLFMFGAVYFYQKKDL